MNDVRTVLAFDFGLRRIGIASGDTLTRSACPRCAITVGTHGPDWDGIAREVRDLLPKLLVVGTPYNVDGTSGALARAAHAFAQELERRFRLPVARVDERYSSLEAAEALKAQRHRAQRGRIRREHIDSAAAAVILERWLAGEGEQT
jgi:putative Holliday junction resolvase